MNFHNNKFPRDLFESHIALMSLSSDILNSCGWGFPLHSAENFSYRNWYSWRVTGISLKFSRFSLLKFLTSSNLCNDKIRWLTIYENGQCKD